MFRRLKWFTKSDKPATAPAVPAQQAPRQCLVLVKINKGTNDRFWWKWELLSKIPFSTDDHKKVDELVRQFATERQATMHADSYANQHLNLTY